MVIYLDILIIVNLIVNYFLLLAAAILSGYTYIRKRIIFASFISAASSVIIFFDFKILLINIIIKFFILFITVVIAFGKNKVSTILMQTFIYFSLNMLLTGMIMLVEQYSKNVYQKNLFFYININPIILVIASLIIYAGITAFALLKDKTAAKEIIEISVKIEDGRWIHLKAFYDTGFKIKDIINNKDVILVDYCAVKQNISENLQYIIDKYFHDEILGCDYRIIPIFYNTIDGQGSMPGIKAKECKIQNKKIDNILLAFLNKPLGESTNAIYGNDINKQL